MFPCEVCQAVFMSISGLNKHLRTKHEGFKKHKLLKKNVYICNDCDESFNVKSLLIKHVKGHINTTDNNMSCSMATCSKSFHKMNGLISHLKSEHNVNIESTFLNFKNIEGKY